jgi:carbamoyl-phosphate synthase large subunit
MGVHTGDSITVAPALTLTDKEYQIMRNGSIAVLREIGVETGGSNVQWAINPADGRMVVIEMNPRVSRSSALASKATGFPIAKIAAKLAIGYTLDELDNDITKVTPASFEPSIDYVVTKIPRFAFEKFPGSEPNLTTAMKSVGEAMAIGRTIHESLQKALASLETGLTGFDEIAIEWRDPTGRRLQEAVRSHPRPAARDRPGHAPRLHRRRDPAITAFDPWFLARIREIVDDRGAHPQGRPARHRRRPARAEDDGLHRCPAGQADRPRRGPGPPRPPQPWRHRRVQAHRHLRRRVRGPDPLHVFHLRSPRDGRRGMRKPPHGAKKVVILGGGPNRIGQGIEFDYCCCHACFALTAAGYETIMVNCNPETVSDRLRHLGPLYFEPLTLEHVLEILRVEQENGTLHGVIVQFGGQTPLKLANALHEEGIPILGTTPDAIDLAEDRERFQRCCTTWA